MNAADIRGLMALTVDTSIAHNMQQTDLHLLGTAPPMPPPPLLQSLPEPSLIPGCGRRDYVAGWEGGGGTDIMSAGSPTSVVSGNLHDKQSKHQQNTARQYACMRRCAGGCAGCDGGFGVPSLGSEHVRGVGADLGCEFAWPAEAWRSVTRPVKLGREVLGLW
jgi:hypothetical protein